MQSLSTVLALVLFTAQAPNAPPAPASAPASQPAGIRLNFKDASLDTVLEHLSETAGLAIVRTVSVDGRITILSRRSLDVDEAVSLLNSALKELKYAAVRVGRVLKIVPLAEAKKASIPVRSGSDPAAIVASDELVTHVIPVRYADATKLKTDLAELVPDYAELAANASSNALILTDTQANVRRIVEIVQALDKHMSDVAEVKVFQLQYADADDTASLINKVFEEDKQTQSRNQSPFARMRAFMRRRGGPPGPPGSDSESGGRSQKVTAAADERTNTVVVSGPPDTLLVVERVIKELDSSTLEEQAVFVYRLKNGDADNLATVLNNLFDEDRLDENQTQLSRTAGGRSGGQTSRRMPMFGPGAGGGGTQTSAGQASDLVGQVYCVADEDTNSLLVLTASKNFDRVKAIIDDLDRPVPQVLIKVLIAEVTHSDSVDLGAEFSILNIRDSGNGQEVFSDFGVAAQTGGLVVKSVEENVNVVLRALQSVGKLDVLSRPYILASDNQEANITVGEEVPFVRNSTTTDSGQTLNTIEYEDIGIILTVTPHINTEGLVILNVSPEISTLTGQSVPISEKLTAPVYAKRSANTRVAVHDGQTIVIGGLIEDDVTETETKIPLLGDIPLLGAAFRRTIKAKNKTELLIFLTPHVAPEAGLLEAMGKDEVSATKVIDKAIKPGVLREHLEGLKRGAAKLPAPAKR